jgi:hypothetical protein
LNTGQWQLLEMTLLITWSVGLFCSAFPVSLLPTDTGNDIDVDDRRTELLECVVAADGCDEILVPNEDNEIFLQGSGYWLDDGLDHAGETVCIPSGSYRHRAIGSSRALGQVSHAPKTAHSVSRGPVKTPKPAQIGRGQLLGKGKTQPSTGPMATA